MGREKPESGFQCCCRRLSDCRCSLAFTTSVRLRRTKVRLIRTDVFKMRTTDSSEGYGSNIGSRSQVFRVPLLVLPGFNSRFTVQNPPLPYHQVHLKFERILRRRKWFFAQKFGVDAALFKLSLALFSKKFEG